MPPLLADFTLMPGSATNLRKTIDTTEHILVIKQIAQNEKKRKEEKKKEYYCFNFEKVLS